MSALVWLDDERPEPPGWHRVQTPEAAIRLLETGLVGVISLDHDLGLDDNRTGYTVAKWIEQAAHDGRLAFVDVRLHTQNPVGRKAMRAAVRNAEKSWRQWEPNPSLEEPK